MEVVWWHWAVAGLFLIVAELVVPSFVLVWFGAGALVVALALLLFPVSLTVQILLWALASIAMVLLWFRCFETRARRTRSGQADQAVGEVGVLIREVAPFQRGAVRFQRPLLGSDLWDCMADEGIRPGERVRVVAVEGSLLRVARG